MATFTLNRKATMGQELIVICASDSASGREVWCGTWKQCPDYIKQGLMLGYDGAEDSLYMASIYSISRSAWLKRHDLSPYGHHSSHYLSKHGEELCLGDFL